MRFLILFFLLNSFTEASVIKVKIGNMKYVLKSNVDRLSLNGQFLELTFDSKKCNEHILKKFRANLDSVLKASKTVELKNYAGKIFEMEVDEKSNHYANNSLEGNFFISLTDTFKTMKLEEFFNCKKE